jgi:predicted nucleic acid-binding protein
MTTAMRRTGTEAAARVLDSSVWIEHLSGGALADSCTPYLLREHEIVTPVQVLYEVYRWTLRHVDEQAAMDVVAHMEATRFAPADVTTSVVAVQLGREHALVAADALIYATARLHHCELVTADEDFRGLPGVILLEEESAGGGA